MLSRLYAADDGFLDDILGKNPDDSANTVDADSDKSQQSGSTEKEDKKSWVEFFRAKVIPAASLGSLSAKNPIEDGEFKGWYSNAGGNIVAGGEINGKEFSYDSRFPNELKGEIGSEDQHEILSELKGLIQQAKTNRRLCRN